MYKFRHQMHELRVPYDPHTRHFNLKSLNKVYSVP